MTENSSSNAQSQSELHQPAQNVPNSSPPQQPAQLEELAEPAAPKKRHKFNTRMPLPFDLPYQEYYAKGIPSLQIFRAAILQHYATESARHNPLKKGLRRFADLLLNHHSHIAAECGVYRGSGLVACAEIIRQYGLNAHIYGLDSFQGFPEFGDVDEELAADLIVDIMKEKGNLFDDTSQVQVQAALDERGLGRYVTLVPGFFAQTLQTLPEGPYFFVNIDCDLYEGHLECLEFFYPKVEKGGIIFLDDYYSVQYPMAKEAVDKFMKGRPESLFHIRYGEEAPNHNKVFFVKH